MNKRMLELYKQAQVPHTAIDPSNNLPYETTRFSADKFAELIVLEMCNVLDKAQWDKGEDWVCADGTRIIPQVKEHFGVEE